ncbi:CynX/NimT family MFS transporter [Barrientosiimonas marina]|uniref:CynX/NimT family MFS transporter n=1 Tax=Lentibacillus kimchii TaxID=1542911 RepID=A0ABW2UY84_9BACI
MDGNTLTNDKTNRLYRFMLYAAIIVTAFNLRPAITSVGPVIGLIRDDMGLSNGAAGVITSLPLLAFAAASPLAPKIGNRFSNEKALLVGLVLLAIGISMRSISSVSLLYIGTFLVGIGIAFGNVLLPAAIKEKLPKKSELMTGIYSTAMNAMAAVASGLSIPVAEGIGLGWQVALLIWTVPALIGVIIWIYLSRKRPRENKENTSEETSPDIPIWKSSLAWQLSLFMGFQSFLFYITISWLPEILHDYGVSMATGGWMLSFMQFVGLPFSFLMPVLAGKFRSQWGLVWLLVACDFIGYSGLLFGHSYVVMVISVILIGAGLGGTFPLALTFVGIRARNGKQASVLSGMAQSFGYLLAAIGPVFMGYLYDATGSWTIPLTTMLIVTLLVIIFGSLAGRNRYVFD